MVSVLYRKWRSQTFSEVVGQEHITQTLLNALSAGRLAHAYLFCGPRGTGKTSTARILAKAANCLDNGQGEPCNRCAICLAITEGRALDLIEIDAASNRGIDEIRDLREKVNFVPNEARFKVYIIDEVHMLTAPAFNALLKTLEEPPAHTIFVLATTEAHQLPSTIVSRCQRFDFRRIPLADMVARLTHICEKEGIAAEPDSLGLIAKGATGSLRDAENMLDQAVAHYGPAFTLSQVQEFLGLTSDLRVQELARFILKQDVPGGLAAINALCQDGADLRQFARQLVEHLRQLLMVKMKAAQGLDLTSEARKEMATLVEGVDAPQLVRAIKLFNQADTRLEGLNSLPLELALVEYSLAPESAASGEPARAERQVREEAPSRPAIAPKPRPAPPLPAGRAGGQDLPAATSGEAIEQLADHWPRILAEARKDNKSIEALLRNSCRVMAQEGDTIVLGFYWNLHKEKVEEVKNRRVVEGVFSRVLGRNCQIRCVLAPKEAGADPASPAQAQEPTPDDPLLKMAMEEFGARVRGQP